MKIYSTVKSYFNFSSFSFYERSWRDRRDLFCFSGVTLQPVGNAIYAANNDVLLTRNMESRGRTLQDPLPVIPPSSDENIYNEIDECKNVATA